MGVDHAQNIRGKTPGDTHFFDFLGGFDRNTHKYSDWLVVEDTGLWYKARAFGNCQAKLIETEGNSRF
jgi:hypothetical protein